MIAAEHYLLVYMIILLIIGCPLCYKYSQKKLLLNRQRSKEPIWKSLLFTVFMIAFFGFRPNNPVFGDGVFYWEAIINHQWEYYSLKDVSYQFVTKWIFCFLSSHNIAPRIGFIVFATIFFGGAFVALRKRYPCDTLLAMVLFCGAFGTYGGAVNGINNGCACSIFLCALAYKDNWKICLPLLVVTFGIHHSLELSITAFILCLIYRNTNTYLVVWLFALAVASLHITFFQTFLAGFTDEHGAGYLLPGEGAYLTGFRWDFILYSMAPLALGFWVMYIKRIRLPRYTFVFNVYVLMNAVWLVCMYASYTNRIASLSWSLFPILILDPLLSEKLPGNRYKILAWFVFGQLMFTFFMGVIR